MQEQTFRFSARDGKPIYTVQWLPDRFETPRAVVQVAHGLAEHCLRYRHFAEYLTARGYAVCASDHRGHGQSLGLGDLHGHFADEDGWNKVLDDLRRVNHEIGRRNPDVPIVLLGHSMGAFIARHYVQRYPETFAGLILSSSAIQYGALASVGRAIARFEAWRLGPRAPSKLMQALSVGMFNLRFFPARTRSDWLSRDLDTVDRYVADPCCGFVCSAQLWIDQFSGILALEAGEKAGSGLPRVPVLMFAGTRDPLSNGGAGIHQLARRYRAAGVIDIETRFYPDGRHEMLNETNRYEVYADIEQWLLLRFHRRHAMAGAPLAADPQPVT